ncbi:MAG: CPBP family intramembrane glutamic endopeptidase [Candidatus Hodarchaeota archaeon]
MKEVEKFDLRQLVLFFLIIFAWTWTFWGVYALVAYEYPPYIVTTVQPTDLMRTFGFLIILGGLGPLIGAFTLTLSTEGKNGISSLLKREANVGFDKIWWVLIVLAVPVVFAISYLFVGFIETVPPIDLSNMLFYYFFAVSITSEFGWRGYLLNQLQLKWSPLISSLIVGLTWGFWMLPLFLAVGMPHSDWFFPYFVILAILISVLFTWFYNNTGGSVIKVLILHAMFYTLIGLSINSLFQTDLGFAVLLLLIAILAILVAIYWEPIKFTENLQSPLKTAKSSQVD